MPGIGGVGKRIDWNLPDIAVGNERVERAGILPFVGVVLIDGVPQIELVGLQHRFAGVHDALPVLRHSHRRQDRNKGQHHKELDDGEARRGALNWVIG